MCGTIEAHQFGADPWDTNGFVTYYKRSYDDDNTTVLPKKSKTHSNKEWFYRRLLTTVLKGGEFKVRSCRNRYISDV